MLYFSNISQCCQNMDVYLCSIAIFAATAIFLCHSLVIEPELQAVRLICNPQVAVLASVSSRLQMCMPLCVCVPSLAFVLHIVEGKIGFSYDRSGTRWRILSACLHVDRPLPPVTNVPGATYGTTMMHFRNCSTPGAYLLYTQLKWPNHFSAQQLGRVLKHPGIGANPERSLFFGLIFFLSLSVCQLPNCMLFCLQSGWY